MHQVGQKKNLYRSTSPEHLSQACWNQRCRKFAHDTTVPEARLCSLHCDNEERAVYGERFFLAFCSWEKEERERNGIGFRGEGVLQQFQ